MSKALLIAGDDKIGRRLVRRIEEAECPVTVYLDRSSSLKRTMTLLYKRRILPKHFIRMAIASITRPETKVGKYGSITSNNDLIELIRRESPQRVYFFRAGLVINKSVINTGIDLLNVHCASIPEYGGLASIPRAIDDSAFHQCATMHRVVERIDSGESLKVEPYEMAREFSYRKNEDIAYEAGIQLLLKEFACSRSSQH